MTKIKQVERTANIAWSPAKQHPIYLAAGTAAQQLDATFRYKTFSIFHYFHHHFIMHDKLALDFFVTVLTYAAFT